MQIYREKKKKKKNTPASSVIAGSSLVKGKIKLVGV
jgi:hypothetical protein